MELDPLNTEKSCTLSYILVKKCFKDCPKRVKRCETCRFEFNGTDKHVAKTVGIRQFMGKFGCIERHQGNVYLHFLTTCLKKFDKTFQYSLLKIPKRTQHNVKREDIVRLLKKYCNLEENILKNLSTQRLFVSLDIKCQFGFEYSLFSTPKNDSNGK